MSLTPEEIQRERAIGYLLQLIEQLGKGAKGFGIVVVNANNTIHIGWESFSEPGCWYQLVAGVETLKQNLMEK